MRIHLLVDWENRQPAAAELAQVRGARYRLWILHGPQQGSFSAEQVAAWQPLGKQVRFVRSAKAGKNALDLHIAFCMGEASANDRHKESAGCYIIVSHDKGFDALFGYLESIGVRARRAGSLTEALGIATEFAEEAKPADPVKPQMTANALRVVENLRASETSHRPTTVRRLTNHIATLLGMKSADSGVAQVLEELKRVNVIRVNGTKPAYQL